MLGDENAGLLGATSVTVVMGGRALGFDMDNGRILGTFYVVESHV